MYTLVVVELFLCSLCDMYGWDAWAAEFSDSEVVIYASCCVVCNRPRKYLGNSLNDVIFVGDYPQENELVQSRCFPKKRYATIRSCSYPIENKY
jgi:hypothetical protein